MRDVLPAFNISVKLRECHFNKLINIAMFHLDLIRKECSKIIAPTW